MPGLLDITTPESPKAQEMFIIGKPKGIVEAGNINILGRPTVKMDDGSVATVRSLSFSDDTGYEILIPTISPDGRIMADREAIDYYYKSGQHLGKFKTPKAASNYAQKLHEQQAEYYGVK
jgi:hypothetical protein